MSQGAFFGCRVCAHLPPHRAYNKINVNNVSSLQSTSRRKHNVLEIMLLRTLWRMYTVVVMLFVRELIIAIGATWRAVGQSATSATRYSYHTVLLQLAYSSTTYSRCLSHDNKKNTSRMYNFEVYTSFILCRRCCSVSQMASTASARPSSEKSPP